MRPAGICCTPNRIEPVPAGDVEERERQRPCPSARAESRIESPESRADQQHADRRERQRRATKRQRRELGDADLQHRPVASPDQGQDRDQKKARGRNAPRGPTSRRHRTIAPAAAIMAAARPGAGWPRRRRTWPGAASAPASPTDRAGCGRETRAAARRTRRCRARSSARSAGSVVMPRLCSMRSSTGPTPTISLRSSGPAAPDRIGGGALFSMSMTSCR